MTTLTLQNNKNANNSMSLGGMQATIFNKSLNTPNVTEGEALVSSNNLMVRGEEFVLIGLNGATPNYRSNQKQTLRGTNEFIGYKAKEEGKNSAELGEVAGSAIASAALSLFPLGHLFEMFKHVAEMATKVTEEQGQKIKITTTTNIDPRDAIDPNKSFLPKTPFYISPSPRPGLWDRVKQSAEELESKKKKKKAKGLGAF